MVPLGSAVLLGIFLEMDLIISIHLLEKPEIPKQAQSPERGAPPRTGSALEKLALRGRMLSW